MTFIDFVQNFWNSIDSPFEDFEIWLPLKIIKQINLPIKNLELMQTLYFIIEIDRHNENRLKIWGEIVLDT